MGAELVARGITRRTPAGLPVLELGLRHRSETVEAGTARRLDFEFDAIAVGDVAARLATQPLGAIVELDGFVAAASRRSKRLKLHVTDFRLTTTQVVGGEATDGPSH